jgi:membrane protein YdbS with pleckstrin-like domain
MNSTVIHRSWFVYFMTAFIGVGAVAVIWTVIFSMGFASARDPLGYYLLAYTSGLILLITLLQIYVYSLSFIQIDDSGITANIWVTLFASNDETTEWVRVQDVSVSKGGIFAQLANFGTLTIQTAGTAQEIVMTYVPDVEHWQSVIEAKAAAATPDNATPAIV